MWHIHNVIFDVYHCNIHHELSHILMFIMVMLHSDIHYGLCHNLLFIKGYIALWNSSMINSLMDLSHCNIHRGLRWIEEFYHCTFLNGFVTLRHSSRVMLDFDVHKGIYWITTYDIYQYLCWIATFLNSAFLNGFVALGHLFMDIEIHHSAMLVSHYSPSCCKNFLDIYIVVWQKKWFKPSTFYIVM